MRFITVSAVVSAAMIGSLLVGASPITTDLAVRSPTIIATTRHIYAANGTTLATIKNGDTTGIDAAILEPDVNPDLVTKAIDAAVSITQAVCTGGNAIGCGVVGAIAVFVIVALIWWLVSKMSGGGGSNTGGTSV